MAVGWLWDDGIYVFHEKLLYKEHCMQERSHGEETSCVSASHFFHFASAVCCKSDKKNSLFTVSPGNIFNKTTDTQLL
jgi:hypothetical protein